MSNPTTPFGWQMPTNTDLVTDLPADFEVFGQAVATSMADLLGGTTGQVLAKATNTNMDFVWTDANPGDITGVTAGTGISGGGTSGTVTVTNSMATAIDAKGDLIVGTGADAFSRLAIGTDTQVLTADSTAATGMKWATAGGSSSFTGAYAYTSGNQTVPNATFTAIAFDLENYDTSAYHDNTTNNTRLTIPSGKAGYYQFTGVMRYGNSSTGRRIGLIEKNGTTEVAFMEVATGSTLTSVLVNVTTYASVGDYFRLMAYQTSGADRVVESGVGNTYFSLTYLGA
jgi:hypothetical protein